MQILEELCNKANNPQNTSIYTSNVSSLKPNNNTVLRQNEYFRIYLQSDVQQENTKINQISNKKSMNLSVNVSETYNKQEDQKNKQSKKVKVQLKGLLDPQRSLNSIYKEIMPFDTSFQQFFRNADDIISIIRSGVSSKSESSHKAKKQNETIPKFWLEFLYFVIKAFNDNNLGKTVNSYEQNAQPWNDMDVKQLSQYELKELFHFGQRQQYKAISTLIFQLLKAPDQNGSLSHQAKIKYQLELERFILFKIYLFYHISNPWTKQYQKYLQALYQQQADTFNLLFLFNQKINKHILPYSQIQKIVVSYFDEFECTDVYLTKEFKNYVTINRGEEEIQSALKQTQLSFQNKFKQHNHVRRVLNTLLDNLQSFQYQTLKTKKKIIQGLCRVNEKNQKNHKSQKSQYSQELSYKIFSKNGSYIEFQTSHQGLIDLTNVGNESVYLYRLKNAKQYVLPLKQLKTKMQTQKVNSQVEENICIFQIFTKMIQDHVNFLTNLPNEISNKRYLVPINSHNIVLNLNTSDKAQVSSNQLNSLVNSFEFSLDKFSLWKFLFGVNLKAQKQLRILKFLGKNNNQQVNVKQIMSLEWIQKINEPYDAIGRVASEIIQSIKLNKYNEGQKSRLVKLLRFAPFMNLFPLTYQIICPQKRNTFIGHFIRCCQSACQGFKINNTPKSYSACIIWAMQQMNQMEGTDESGDKGNFTKKHSINIVLQKFSERIKLFQ